MTDHFSHSLSGLLVGMVKQPAAIPNMTVTGIEMDSRKVVGGTVFIATAKSQQQRQKHIEQAVEKGAVAVLVEAEMPLDSAFSVPVVDVFQLDSKISEIASRFYQHPSLAMKVIAVTGTNGKTSVSQFIAQSLEVLEQSCGVIGTLGIGTLTQLESSGMTTPDPVSIQAALARLYIDGVETVVIEASSHALVQDRLRHVAIDIALLTNFSRDHLDYHKTMESYAEAKKALFHFDSVSVAVLNTKDTLGQALLSELTETASATIISYGVAESKADFNAEEVVATQQGLSFKMVNNENQAQVQSKLLGQFNIANLLATASCLSVLGFSFEETLKAIENCTSVKGRMQSYNQDEQATIVIDFAHTPDALEQALQSLKSHMPQQGKLWCVFGCGGDRDTGKRALMGAVAENNADQCVVTADNPRSEDNTVIASQIVSGMTKPDIVLIEHDRKQAIQQTIQKATVHDIVLIAGKGHEDYQELKGVKYPYSDEAVVLEAFQAANDASMTIEAVQ